MIKYSVQFSSYDDTKWEINIENNVYMGQKIAVYGSGKECAILAYEAETDSPFAVFHKSKLTINLLQQGQMDVNELQQVQDREWTVNLYRNGVIYWKGFLIADGIHYPISKTRYKVTLTAICGLAMLEKMDYVHADLPGGRTPINYFRQILYGNLGILLPIKWTNNLQCTAFIGQDVFAGGVQWSTDNTGFYSYQSGQNGSDQGPIKSCGYILEGMLKAFQCRIFQTNGQWIIRRIPEYIGSTLISKTIAANLGPLNVITLTENVKKAVGVNGYQLINEDQVITTRPGIKTARVTYDSNVRQNILPNGNQDVADGTGTKDWGFYEAGTDSSATSRPGIDGRGGKSTFLDNESTTDDIYYTLKTNGGSYGNNGLPLDTNTLIKRLSFGFLISIYGGVFVEPESEVIVWDNEPIKIQIIYNLGSTTYYLNEFGFWQTIPIEIPIIIQGLSLYEVARVDFDKFQGIIMPTDGVQPEPGDVSDITVAFKVRNGVPSNAATYYVDNIYLNIDIGKEVYESTYAASKNTTVEEETLNISSSFGGYQLSNFMTDWSESDAECFYRDGLAYENTLTGLTANVMMRCLYKASKIFNGSINTRGENWTFDEIYYIDPFGTSTFMMLGNTSYNIEKNEVNLVAMECRNDNVIFTQKFYNSNDFPLSN